MNFTAIDFETANPSRTSACSLGLTVVRNNQIVETRYWLIKPYPIEFSAFNTAIHGITEADVKSMPTFDSLWPEVFPYIENQIVVAHNASFDVSVLRQCMEHYQIAAPNFDILCTYRIAQSQFPNAGSHRLNIICQLMDIPLEHHHAASDSNACAQILCRLMSEHNLNSLKELKKYCNIKSGYYSEGKWYKPCRLSRSIKEEANYSKEELCIDDDFNGKSFVFTGTLLSMPRAKAQEIVTRGGGIIQNGINKKTDFLVVGIQDYQRLNGHTESSKMRKAYELQEKGFPLKIISEDDFISFIDDELYSLCF